MVIYFDTIIFGRPQKKLSLITFFKIRHGILQQKSAHPLLLLTHFVETFVQKVIKRLAKEVAEGYDVS